MTILKLLLESDDEELGQRGTDALSIAVCMCMRQRMMKPLLKRGAVPISQLVWMTVRVWDDPETLQLLLSHPKSDPIACRTGSLWLLLADPRVDPTYGNYDILERASKSANKHIILPILMEDERLRAHVS